MPRSEHPRPQTVRMLEHEYSLRDELDPLWAVRSLALTMHDGRVALVLEDPGGEPLSKRAGAPIATAEVLRIGAGLSAALRHLHARGFIHKDIKPANVMTDGTTGQVWLRGFGIASRLPRERRLPEPPEFIAGTLAYMAPEQTGWMNRSIDARSDLYALGVVLYELSTGSLPLTRLGSDGVGARPHRGASGAAGRAADRHTRGGLGDRDEAAGQDRRGSLSDGRRRRARPAALPRAVGSRPAGSTHSRSPKTTPPTGWSFQKRCMDARARSRRCSAPSSAWWRAGHRSWCSCRGTPGSASHPWSTKLHKVLVPPRGLFASGKFDQYKRDIPYSTLAQAFQSLVRYLLGKSDAELSGWRDALVEALGPNGPLMIDLVPELKLIIGDQPPVPELAPQDARSRFQVVLRRFIGVFARPDHPLALFLDDLQWLDAATLDLLEDLLTPPGVPHLMLIGAYRDNEVTPAHPLARTLEAIRNMGSERAGDRACAARVRTRAAARGGCSPLRPGARRPARSAGAREDVRQSVLPRAVSADARRGRMARVQS